MVKKKEICVVKRRTGVCETYDEKKVYGSVYAACYVVEMDKKECEKIADSVVRKITSLVKKKKEVTSKIIMREVTKELKKHNKDASFMFKTHMDIA